MLGALRVLRDRNVRIGEELSFVGCDDIDVTELYEPQISVVRRNTRTIGDTAAELMLEVLTDNEGRQEHHPAHRIHRSAKLRARLARRAAISVSSLHVG